MNIVGISGNLGRPSRTRTLVSAILSDAAARRIGTTDVLDLVDAGPHLGVTLSRGAAPDQLDQVLTAIETADVLVAASPIYKASYTGLFKHLFDLLDPKALEGRQVLLAATAGSQRHALAIEHQMRPLFAFFGAHVLPISIFAVNDDFVGDHDLTPQLRTRISRAVDQFDAILARRFADETATLVRSVA